MIHSWQDMAMDISIIEEFNLLSISLKEFAKHI
jgi:hypothetical protein